MYTLYIYLIYAYIIFYIDYTSLFLFLIPLLEDGPQFTDALFTFFSVFSLLFNFRMFLLLFLQV